MKGCICHFTSGRMHPFMCKGRNHNMTYRRISHTINLLLDLVEDSPRGFSSRWRHGEETPNVTWLNALSVQGSSHYSMTTFQLSKCSGRFPTLLWRHPSSPLCVLSCMTSFQLHIPRHAASLRCPATCLTLSRINDVTGASIMATEMILWHLCMIVWRHISNSDVTAVSAILYFSDILYFTRYLLGWGVGARTRGWWCMWCMWWGGGGGGSFWAAAKLASPCSLAITPAEGDPPSIPACSAALGSMCAACSPLWRP